MFRMELGVREIKCGICVGSGCESDCNEAKLSINQAVILKTQALELLQGNEPNALIAINLLEQAIDNEKIALAQIALGCSDPRVSGDEMSQVNQLLEGAVKLETSVIGALNRSRINKTVISKIVDSIGMLENTEQCLGCL